MPIYEYLQNTGVIIPDTSNIRAQVEDEYKDAFTADLSVAPETPQGVLITDEALARSSVVRNNATLANQINPNLAGGVFLDAIGALTGVERSPQTFSRVNAELTGVAGTVIPPGVTASNTNGDIFSLLIGVTLDGSGLGTGSFEASQPGAIATPINSFNTIVEGVLGWETVNNSVAGTLGTETQSDQSFRLERKVTLGAQGTATLVAIKAAVYLVPTVLSATIRENIAATTQVIDGVTMVAHSIYLCVDGGTDVDVATAILEKKSAGCNYNNGASGFPVSQAVVEPASGQTYTVKFDRPDPIAILVQIDVNINSSISDVQSKVQDAILAYVAGELDNEPGFVVGASVSPFELSGAVNRQIPALYVKRVEIAVSSGSPVFAPTEIPIAVFEKATLTRSNITVNLV